MPIPGKDILRRIHEYSEQLDREEQQTRDAAKEMSAEIDRIVTDQSSAFRELAELYLPRLEDDVEKDGWAEVQTVLQSIILRKNDARRQLQNRLQTATQHRIAAETQRAQLSDRIHSLTAQCDQLANRLAETSGQDVRFQTLSRQAAEGQARLEQAQASLEDVLKDASVKLPSYQKSRLFLYLWSREFGTDRYDHRGVIRSLDRWLSRLIDYPRAAAGYRFLTSVPKQMKQLIAEQELSVRALVSEVETRQLAAAQSVGLPQAQAAGAQAKAELESAAAAAEGAAAAEQSIQKELAELDSPDCQFYREALSTFQALLQRTERTIVAARAAQTPETLDDQVVARLRHLDDLVTAKKQQMTQLGSLADDAAKKTSRVRDLESRCRRAQFDHPRRVFDDDFDLDHFLNAVGSGALQPESVYQEMYRRQKLDSPIADHAAAALEGPMASILLQTMAHAAGAALGAYAARAGQQHRLPKQKDWF